MEIYRIPFYKGMLIIKIDKDSLYELRYSSRTDNIAETDKDDNVGHWIVSKVREYIKGKKVLFDDIHLIYPYGTKFMKSVWRITRKIPYGEIRSYKWVAEQLGIYKGYQAIGIALSKNPHLIVTPCHRVIRSDGSIGGFSSEGGVELKKHLLRLEGYITQAT
jgi:O-6-methylguanine DNA methyltransferase